MHLDVFIDAVDVPSFSWEESQADPHCAVTCSGSPQIVSERLPDSYRIFHDTRDLFEDSSTVSKQTD